MAEMPAIFLVSGPSGVGKDSLLMEARAADRGIVFVPRDVTRCAEHCTDLERPVSAAAFAQREERGYYAITWSAHEETTHYGVPIAELEAALQGASSVVLNVSRKRRRKLSSYHGPRRNVESEFRPTKRRQGLARRVRRGQGQVLLPP